MICMWEVSFVKLVSVVVFKYYFPRKFLDGDEHVFVMPQCPMNTSKHPRLNATIIGLKAIQNVCNYEHHIIIVNAGPLETRTIFGFNLDPVILN